MACVHDVIRLRHHAAFDVICYNSEILQYANDSASFCRLFQVVAVFLLLFYFSAAFILFYMCGHFCLLSRKGVEDDQRHCRTGLRDSTLVILYSSSKRGTYRKQ